MDLEKVLEKLNQSNQNTMMEAIGIKYTEFTGDTLTAEMHVNSKVHQPYGLLHGGATAALAETVGSSLSAMQANDGGGAVGTNLNIYHLRSKRDGIVTAKASFIRKGRSLHVVDIQIMDENQDLIAKAILTNKVIVKKSHLGGV